LSSWEFGRMINDRKASARRILAFAAMLLAICALLACPLQARAQREVLPESGRQSILFLYSYGYGGKGLRVFDEGFFDTLGKAGFSTSDVYPEFLDLGRNQDDREYPQKLASMLEAKYSGKKIDLVVTGQQPALWFLLREGKKLAPGAPVITVQAPLPSEEEAAGRRFLCQVSHFDIKGTLERALELFPSTRRVVFVSGASDADKRMADEAAKAALPWQGKLELEYTTGLSLPEMLNRVSSLPPFSVIIFTQYNKDTSGRATLAYEVEGMVTKAANAPVFGLYDFNLSNGGIGGSVISVRDLGETTARFALDILRGKLILEKPVTVADNRAVPIFDWKQIERWGGEAKNLPKESVFIGRPPLMWEEYKGYLIFGFVVLLAQSLLIGALLVQRRRREKAEKELLTSEERFRAIFEGAPVGIGMARGQKHLLVNAAHARLFGYDSPEELLSVPVASLLPVEAQAELIERNKRRERGEDLPSTYETTGLRKDGTTFPFLIDIARIQLPEGAATLGFFRDLSEIKRMEAERARLESQLLQSQKIESVGQLAGGVAHDFNNMLGVILGHAEFALDQTEPSDPLRESLEEIQKAAKRSAQITRQLLAFARKQPASPKVLDLNDTIEAMLRMLRRLIGEDIELEWKPGGHLWRLKIDPSQVDQLLANLVANARDAIPGVGKIEIETDNVTLDEQYCEGNTGFVPGEYVLLSVSDSGSGMEKEELSKIFDPFYTTKEPGKGTGLGLSTVYGIVKQNGGFINVYSEPGFGTTFRIYLPRTLEEAAAVAEPVAAVRRGSETILVVEDEEAILGLARRSLASLGYRVLAAGNAAEAQKLAEENKGSIDLLITDVVMPEMNGKELAERISTITPGIKCLFMSGYTAEVIAHRGVIDEGVNFLPKPFSLKTLGSKVREVLDEKQQA
jgi:PAS domain S-box-containing protein